VTHHDLVIIGSGSGNSIVDHRFADWSVGLVEEGTFGGTCLNVGCIPTKMFVYPADIARAARSDGARLGVHATVEKIDWPAIRDRIFGRIDAISAGGLRWRLEDNPNVDVYQTHVELTGQRSFRTADGREVTTDRLVVAAGSRAVLPQSVTGLAEAFADPSMPVHTSDTVMRIGDLPRRVLILGGGYVSAEFAHVFSAFGAEVVIVNRSAGMLRSFDADIAAAFSARAAEQWHLVDNHDAVAVEATPDEVRLRVRDHRSGVETVLCGDLLLVAAGRRPNTDRLGVEAAGFDVAAGGRLLADDYQRVLAGGQPVDGVWTLGDISAEHQLKHVANHEMRVVAHNLLHPNALRRADHRFVPGAVFSHPQVATVGLTEQEAIGQGLDVVAVKQPYASIGYGWAMEEPADGGFAKVIAERSTGRLVGAHLIGHEASVLIQPLIQAMSFGLPAHEMARGQYWTHPALPELIENALLALPLDVATPAPGLAP